MKGTALGVAASRGSGVSACPQAEAHTPATPSAADLGSSKDKIKGLY